MNGELSRWSEEVRVLLARIEQAYDRGTMDRALDLLHEASHLLHAAALPAGSPDTVHISATTHAFTMTGGLTGEPARWNPAKETR